RLSFGVQVVLRSATLDCWSSSTGTYSWRDGVSTSAPEQPRAVSVEVVRQDLVVHLQDGRTVSVPLEWFPKLREATQPQLADHRLVGKGVGIHWPQLDEDLSVRGLLMPEAQRPVRKTA